MSGRKQQVMIQPINVIFKYLQQRTKVSVWLYDNVDCRLQGRIIGFDEYMNLILDDVEEVFINKKQSQPNSSLGRILLKGDNITLIQSV
ncbi:hypothetical protein E3P92_01388 [Wallemia ichthyophaga]|uniref:Small nuclear ribonucleoprotein E n=2 Tax=Wallemia ichthyophaga TaxID=245174 RepID=A0A4T0IXP9_WALIC|nr:putative small nuclear ribonucleoprotein E [Wallemia ichthyophaga EXF-994]TIA74271.1 hypothetical protein E3P91_01097 [Wallemia ichthyophaga]EOQ99754.1 putative small nuclear ribonucleoprotein E [Wallemia ichthyophaga EXF-994]TIA82763.1 hypothetical protein E3P98_01153 [Wallemia ichthyophaga]TIA92633.1 hypothetical protein E3P97_01402 [Wallemia ichthyophaga]TIB01778.1 hypothetical protein E3P95_01239 [Wallemia ichthyophaga]